MFEKQLNLFILIKSCSVLVKCYVTIIILLHTSIRFIQFTLNMNMKFILIIKMEISIGNLKPFILVDLLFLKILFFTMQFDCTAVNRYMLPI